MPDISMCLDHTCPSAKTCFRHEAEASRWQTYGKFERKPWAKKCEAYWPFKGKGQKKRLQIQNEL